MALARSVVMMDFQEAKELTSSLPYSALQSRKQDKLQKLWVPGLSPKTPETSTTNASPGSISDLSGVEGSPESVPDVSGSDTVKMLNSERKLLFFQPGTGAFLPKDAASEGNLQQELRDVAMPSRWKLCVDAKGRAFYFNASRGVSSWSHPREALHQELRDFVDAFRRDGEAEAMDSVDQRAKTARCFLEELNAKARRDLSSWRGPFLSKEGRFPYWFSDEQQSSSWTDPAADWEEQLAFASRTLCHELNLEASELVPRSTKVSNSFRVAAKGVVAAQSFRRMSEHHRSYSMDKAVPLRTIEQIDLDIPRTASGEAELLSCLGVARALLLRHAAEDPELGYCQGMNMVAALFAVAAQSQEEAFSRFRAFTRSLRGLWEPGFPLLQQGVCLFEALAAERPWFQHLNRNGVEAEMYLPRAWLGLFTSWLPLATRVLLLRSLEEGSLAMLLATSLAIMDHVGSELLEQGDDMDDLLKVLDGIKDKPPHPAALITARDAWLPVVSATTARRSGAHWCWKALRRDGSRVLDHRGEALFTHKERRASLATAGRALLKFCFGDGRH